MTVYVDNMKAAYGRMTMCHMIADTEEELHAMAARIGVARRWHQKPGTAQNHYDICLSKRVLAVQFGAIEIDLRQTAMMCRRRYFTGALGQPEEAVEWLREFMKARKSLQDMEAATADASPKVTSY